MLKSLSSDNHHFLAFRQFAHILFRYRHLLTNGCRSYSAKGDGLFQGFFGNLEAAQRLDKGDVVGQSRVLARPDQDTDMVGGTGLEPVPSSL